MAPTEKLNVVELFAGAGGLALGFKQTGKYDIVALSDIDKAARDTYIGHDPTAAYICKDVSDLQPHELLDQAAGRQIHGVLGGPPCQGFSLAGKMDRNDTRNRYINEYAQFVKKLDPLFLLMENVPQVLFHPRFQDLLQELESKYIIHYAILNAALYGVPQTRHRAFLLAFRRDLELTPTLPIPSHGIGDQTLYNYVAKRLESPEDARRQRQTLLGAGTVFSRNERLMEDQGLPHDILPLVTIEDALADLEGLAAGASSREYCMKPTVAYQKYLRAGYSEVYNHVARAHKAPMQNLIQLIPEGGDLTDVDQILWPKSHYSQAYGRLHYKGLSRTVTTFFCNAGSGRFLHPVDSRTITVREAARLQGFPDAYVFIGHQSQQMRLVGNAVPPPLAHAIGHHVASILRSRAEPL